MINFYGLILRSYRINFFIRYDNVIYFKSKCYLDGDIFNKQFIVLKFLYQENPYRSLQFFPKIFKSPVFLFLDRIDGYAQFFGDLLA